MSHLTITPIPLLTDNYAWLLRDAATGFTCVVDPSTAGPVATLVDAHGGRLDVILNTHHHPDHTGGNSALKERYGALVIAPSYDQGRIAAQDRGVSDGERFMLGAHEVHVLYIPGHTLGHVAYWLPSAEAVFCGDTLFSLGCGRLFEGTPEQMWQSLCRLAALPGPTRVYCGHEYTEANAKFALAIDPDLAPLQDRYREVQGLRRAGLPSVPSTIAGERATNPFLRAGDARIKASVGLAGATDAAVFAALRQRKDHF